MSHRYQEFADEARERLAAARDSISAGHFSSAVGLAYYAMLYAARAALSERDLHAKTHSGTWTLFGEHLVRRGIVDERMPAMARKAERLRYQADYDAADIEQGAAEAVLTDAEQFVAAVLGAVE